VDGVEHFWDCKKVTGMGEILWEWGGLGVNILPCHSLSCSLFNGVTFDVE